MKTLILLVFGTNDYFNYLSSQHAICRDLRYGQYQRCMSEISTKNIPKVYQKDFILRWDDSL